MGFIDDLLERPSYGWTDEKGSLVVPTSRQLWAEAFKRINVFRSRKNWLPFVGWLMVVSMLPFLFLFITRYFSWEMAGIFLLYSLIIMGTHGTIWYHRYCTHRSYRFSHPLWRLLTQNLVIKTLPEEVYVVSHHVHHAKSDQPGDPYNARAGLLYCMLADVNHQGIAKDLSEKDYHKATRFMEHTGVGINTFEQYKRRGSITTPLYTLVIWFINWTLWYTLLYWIGGHALACTIFSAAMVWFVGVRAFNYTGHGKGHEHHAEGIDFDRSNLSINQNRPGWFAGEWHNNHHLFPGSARCGFLKYQLDTPWIYIYCLYKLGAVSSFHDSKKEFLKKYGSHAPESAFGDKALHV